MAETADKNMIDKDEYPQTAEIEARCVNILADLWSSPEARERHRLLDHRLQRGGDAVRDGAEVALARADAEGGQADRRPNLVMGANVQVCWEKFCRYWEVEPRWCRWRATRFHLTAERAIAHCDENTIGVVAILGSTFDGSYEPVKEISDALDQFEADKGIYVPLHVDAASGGFVAPFLQPDLEWDFRIPRVQSINASGHKYGLVYPGVGWAIWRDKAALPRELVFDVNYLGGDMPTFALNFSRPGSEVLAQYFMFMSPRDATGYTEMMQNLQERGHAHLRGDRRHGALQADLARATSCRCSPSRSIRRSRTTPCSTSRTGCASAAGWFRPTASPRTART